MKILVWLLVLSFLGLMIMMFIVTLKMAGQTACLEKSTNKRKLEKITQEAQKWDTKRLCEFFQADTSELVACYKDNQSKFLIPQEWIDKVIDMVKPDNSVKTLEEIVKEHNLFCTNYPEFWVNL